MLMGVRCTALRNEVASDDLLPPVLAFTVRRPHILEDSWNVLLETPVSHLLAPELSVDYAGEEGVDGGGLMRDWFDAVAQALLDGTSDVRGSSLFALAPDGTLIPRMAQDGSEDVYRYLIAAGRFLALAVLHKQPLPLSFSHVACKHFLCIPVGMGDVRRLDRGFYLTRVEQVLKEGGLAETATALGEPLTFMSAPTDLRPTSQELKPGGAAEIVTENNLQEYVQLLCEAYLCGSIRRELQCFLQGFWDLLPFDTLNQCEVSACELSVLISGVDSLDPHEWMFHSKSDVSHVCTWFWQLVAEIEESQRCKLLHFVTGSSRLPPAGFSALDPLFSVSVSSSDSPDHLPHAHTCVNQLILCAYASKAQLKEKLLAAISEKDFGFA